MNMKRLFMRGDVLGAVVTLIGAVASAALAPEWRMSQEVTVSDPGLQQMRLPLATLAEAQGSLADLRLQDAEGREIPYFIDSPTPEPARDLPLDRMSALMLSKKTIITGMVPEAIRATGIDGVTLLTPTDDFLKPITLEGSADGRQWVMITRQAPIFKQSGDPASSAVPFRRGSWAYLRVTLDDAETPPLRISQIRLHSLGRPLQELQDVEPRILESASDGHRTEIRLQLPADDLPIEDVRLDVAEGTFRRQVHLARREFSGGEFRETPFAQGSLYRVSIGAQKSERLTLPVRGVLAGRQMTLTVENADSPPLTIRRITVNVIPRDLIFDAPHSGRYTLSFGNPQAPARQYDVAALRGTLGRSALMKPVLGEPNPNSDYAAPMRGDEAIQDEGTDIDLGVWPYRKKVEFSTVAGQPALWRIELDPEAVAHSRARVEGLRLVRKDQQYPFVVDYAGVERSVALTIVNDTNVPRGQSRWIITLPYDGLPISRLKFTVPQPLFQRSVTLYEIVAHPQGGERPEGHSLAWDTWVRTRPGSPETFELTLKEAPSSKSLILETDNGDNAPIQLASVQAYYRVPRLLFRTKPQPSPLYLYYGQSEVAAPQYDLNLISGELLSTPPQEARLGAEEVLKASPWWDAPTLEGHQKTFFWVVMTLVVLGLLAVIAKLLPEEAGKS